MRDLVKTLLEASFPLINAGHGVLWAEAAPELLAFAELTRIPVLTTLAGKSSFPETHPLALGAGGYSATGMVRHFLNKADFVLGLGTSFSNNHFNTPMPEGVTLGQVTNYAEDLGKNRNVRCGAIGDARIVLRQMIEEVKRQGGEKGRRGPPRHRLRYCRLEAGIPCGVGRQATLRRGSHQSLQSNHRVGQGS